MKPGDIIKPMEGDVLMFDISSLHREGGVVFLKHNDVVLLLEQIDSIMIRTWSVFTRYGVGFMSLGTNEVIVVSA